MAVRVETFHLGRIEKVKRSKRKPREANQAHAHTHTHTHLYRKTWKKDLLTEHLRSVAFVRWLVLDEKII